MSKEPLEGEDRAVEGFRFTDDIRFVIAKLMRPDIQNKLEIIKDIERLVIASTYLWGENFPNTKPETAKYLSKYFEGISKIGQTEIKAKIPLRSKAKICSKCGGRGVVEKGIKKRKEKKKDKKIKKRK